MDIKKKYDFKEKDEEEEFLYLQESGSDLSLK
jgi:hypothetical protein